MRKTMLSAALAAMALTAAPAMARDDYRGRDYRTTDNGIRYWQGEDGRTHCRKRNGHPVRLLAVLRVLAFRHRPVPLETAIAETAGSAPEVLLAQTLAGEELNPHVPPESRGLRRLAKFLA